MKKTNINKMYKASICVLIVYFLSINYVYAAKKLVEIDDDNFMQISNFAPGGSYETGIDVKNVSENPIKYSISVERTGGSKKFFRNLQVVIKTNDVTRYEGSFAKAEKIAMGTLNSNKNIPVTFYVHFPEESGNKYQGLSANLSVRVDAKQTNSEPDPDLPEDDPEDEPENPDPKEPYEPEQPEHPSNPNNPEDSGDPKNPGSPENPENPEDSTPENLDQPDEPGLPDDPENPNDNLERPEDPETEDPEDDRSIVPGGNDGPEPGPLPQTGETGNMLFYLIGILGMTIGVCLYQTALQSPSLRLMRKV
ncbi:LPXTG cell wall anchor domain-containing protein [Alteribacillus bidgolensis]|uniref:LPXTG-motif cell wall anchor domain-containing protein n=1 Tax=Alteribacillus bidgolensis TaxID=930129 RepID=A0A1G8L4U0_9BACI|nr:LPXTG cell wall anchor domain-containing protein [Alteribacillus bidgolensis]SDI50689.1 LPXTG-motif cell wall anchor domain-containing protein [Alteribacillus bidgolensis]